MTQLTFEELLSQVKALPDMGAEERIVQKIDWVWGNLEASNHHRPASKDFIAAMVWRREWIKLRQTLATVASITDDPDVERFVKEALK